MSIGVGAADRLDASFGQTEVPDLALADEFADGAGDVLDRHVRVDPVLVQQVDAVCPQPLERRFHHVPDALRPAV